MATAETLIPNKEIKVEGEKVSRKDGVKVTNLLSEIRTTKETTELPKESAMQVDPSEDKQSDSKEKEAEEAKDEGIKPEEKEDKEAKGDEVKEADDGEKNTDVIKEDDVEKKEGEDAKKSDSEKKKTEDAKKEDSENKKNVDPKKLEKDGKKGDEKKLASVVKKNDSPRKSSKSDTVSPLAAFFSDWDKFTTEQKIDLENYVRDKAQKMGVSTKLKPGVRTISDRERNYYRWSAIRRRRRREAIRRMEAMRGRSPRDRRLPTRFRGAGDMRYRGPRDDRRRVFSPRRELAPWRGPWTAGPMPVQHVLEQMERFVQLVNMLPNPNGVVRGEPKRLALLPTPPEGYISSRANVLHEAPIKDEPVLNTEKTYGPSRWPPVPKFPLSGKEPSSRSPWKQRPSPYRSRPSFSSAVQSRERDFPQATALVPFKESRYSPNFPWRRN